MTNARVQQIAKKTMSFIKSKIKAGMSLQELRSLAEDKMLSLGATCFWYWGIGAFVFSGEDTALSVSGRRYSTPEKFIEANDIITIDLSPQVGKVWGDFARTVIIEDGSVIEGINAISNADWRNSLLTEEKLHNLLLDFAKPKTTFEELYFYINKVIVEDGYVNLDFLGNLGHSIATSKSKRIYIEKGNKAPLGSVKYFTFEPHIAARGSKYGVKKENIYYFENDILKEL